MLSVVRVHLPSEIPIVGCELTPYVLLRRPDKTVSTDDVPETAPLDGHFLRYKWYRVQSDKKVAVCSIHPSEQATLQCLGCVKAKIPLSKSYHCTTKCFSDAWQHHRVLHDRAASALNENGNEEEEVFGRFNSTGSGAINSSLSSSASSASFTNGAATPLYPAAITQRGGETWFEVGRSKTYTPTADDVGHVLKFECVVVDAETKLTVGHVNTILTSRVIPAPSPIPRQLIPVDGMGHLDVDGRMTSSGTFTVLSYNILSEAYASNDLYNYCPSWALSWPYRRQNLLREIVGYSPDIICLQEVQNDHFEEFFSPELDKHGYYGLYKRKTNEVYSGNTNTIDGCATFFRRDRFAHVKKYEVGTWELIVFGCSIMFVHKLEQCVLACSPVFIRSTFNSFLWTFQANTHVNVSQDLKDVKLWQVHTLLKGLEKIAASADIPMLVCGDFNSVPGSAPHSLLAMGKVDPSHPDLAVDPLNILRPRSKLVHQLPLVSAYSSFARTVGLGYEQHKRRLDGGSNEPLFTNVTRDFIGTLDYIFYTADTLVVESLLELLDEESLRKDTALPSPEWSSDHIALLAKFRCCKNKSRR
uniref:poly(A)-specific ribonuclease n=1 Tax=Cajanus cajan TaxID=3821 RepID=A0A151U3S6_CAJCA|nr:Carbon catabolite repressor protein 4 isogeny 2 [Cajanus cajan]